VRAIKARRATPATSGVLALAFVQAQRLLHAKADAPIYARRIPRVQFSIASWNALLNRHLGNDQWIRVLVALVPDKLVLEPLELGKSGNSNFKLLLLEFCRIRHCRCRRGRRQSRCRRERRRCRCRCGRRTQFCDKRVCSGNSSASVAGDQTHLACA
jgi:hypothetical protein